MHGGILAGVGAAPVVQVDGALGLVELRLVHRGSFVAAIGSPVERALHEGGGLVHHLHLPAPERGVQPLSRQTDAFLAMLERMVASGPSIKPP